ncbi:hypothetical protein MES4922_410009 [Mesorhizobium ventifaucium]|uniref:Uncharacterized protein n=1 Tax=Mesorhizobium ventifaucium TaxID=666020 RepID=A0ABM9E9N7_9HYPH|nr:hypothetical protein MES4922_410009 [Mesorhizobium ventifaucium]
MLLRIGLHLSCQLGKSFANNAIALAALCHMSDIVENPTTAHSVITGSTSGADTVQNSSSEAHNDLTPTSSLRNASRSWIQDTMRCGRRE